MSLLKKIFNKKVEKWLPNEYVLKAHYRLEAHDEARACLSAVSLIDQFSVAVMTNAECERIANDWIDSPSVCIRENNDCDYTIDTLMEKKPEEKLEVSVDEPIFLRATQYVKSQVPDADVVMPIISNLESKVEAQIDALIDKHIKEAGGLAHLNMIMRAVQEQNSAFLLEMHDELVGFVDVKKPQADELLQNYCSLAADGSSLRSGGSYIHKVVEAAYSLAVIEREIARRRYAILFFRWFENIIANRLFFVQSVDSLLASSRNVLQKRLSCLIQTDEDGKYAIAIPYKLNINNFIADFPDFGKADFSKISADDLACSLADFALKYKP